MLIILFCHTHLGHVCSTTVWLTNNTDLIILSLCVHIASGTSHPLCLYPGVLGRHETAGGLNWLLIFQIVKGKKRSEFFFIYFFLILAFLLIRQFFPQWLPCAIPSKIQLYCFSLSSLTGEWNDTLAGLILPALPCQT